MEVFIRQSARTTPDIKAGGIRKLDAEVKLCSAAMANLIAHAMRAKKQSAARKAWLVNDTADAGKSFLAKAEDMEQRAKQNSQLAEVQTGLNEFRSYLDRLLTAV
jgi:hypothetical protein